MNQASLSANGTPSNSYKVVILGSGAVGKTSLTIRYFNNTWSEEYNPTLQDIYRKPFELDNQKGHLEILDTAGMEQYTVLQEQWIQAGKGFVLLYSIIDVDSFAEVKSLKKKIEQTKGTRSFPLVLVANKCDLEKERAVTKEEGQAMATEFGGCPFIETSAKLGLNCTEAFNLIIRQIRKTEQKAQGEEVTQKKFLCC